MRKSVLAASVLALTVAVAPACATKKFVRGEVGNVNTKVDTLTGTVEETQERTRRNEERIGAVDEKAERRRVLVLGRRRPPHALPPTRLRPRRRKSTDA